MSKKNIQNALSAVMSIFILGVTNAQTKTETPKSVLWEVSGKDIKTSYIFGTMHLMPKDDFLIDAPTKKSFDAADQIVFEVDMKEMENPTVIMGMMGKMIMPGDTTIKDLISDEDYKLLKSKFDASGLPLEMMQTMKPMFLSMLTDGDALKGGLTGAPNADVSNARTMSYELEFSKLAKTENKTTAGLETMDFQLGLFDSIPLKAQADMLVDGLKNKSDGKDEMKDMVKIYLDKDIEKMSGLISADKSSKNGMASFEAMFLNNRNANWISKIEKLMHDKSSFIAVGAAHLGGTKGVLNLLKLKGYTVKPLQIKA